MAEIGLANKTAVNTKQQSVSDIRVSISDRNINAAVFIPRPAFGSGEITVLKLKQALEEKGVIYGIREDVLEQIVKEKRYESYVEVAVATPAKDGTDGAIDYKFEKDQSIKPKEDQFGNVDYRELGKIRNILMGTVIATITAPTEGESGRDVCGREMAAKPGKRAAFSVGVGTALSDDGSLLTASIDGVLYFDNGIFSVRRDLIIRSNVDFSTGNIEFLGDINIMGNIGEGFKVVSTGGNITVYGGVFSGAEINAKGNIIIKNVVNHAIVKSGGSMNLNFCEYCTLSAGGDITVQTLVVSDVYCGGTLIAKGKNGGLIGGKYTIISGAEVINNVGSPHFPKTEILLGNNSVLEKERKELTWFIARRKNEIVDLTMIIDYLNNKKKEESKLAAEKEEILGDSVRSRILINRDITIAEKRITEITELLENRQSLRLDVGGTIFEKTKININTKSYVFTQDSKHVAVYLGENDEFRFDYQK